VPAYSRPREDRPVHGYAVERGTVPTAPGSGHGSGSRYPYYYYPYYGYYGYPSYYSPYYYPYGAYGLGFGLGFGLYDPFWDPGYYGYGGYGYGGGFGYPAYGYGGGGGSSSSSRQADTGALKLKIKPRDAQVFVDGYLAGRVDEFDGMFQKLELDAGGHTLEVKADGYQPEKFDVLITPNETVTYKGELKPVVE
jgi:hypothetical protein